MSVVLSRRYILIAFRHIFRCIIMWERTIKNSSLFDNNSGLKPVSDRRFSIDSSIYWRNPPSDKIAFQFCHETSLHGLKYVGQRNRHISERIFWIIAFTSGLALATYLILDVWEKYRSNPVFVAFAPTEMSISKLPFPAITLCNMNRILKNVADDIFLNATSPDESVKKKALEEIDIMKSVCASNPSLSKMMIESQNFSNKEGISADKHGLGETSVIDFLYKAAQPCHELVQRCFFGDFEFDCDLQFLPVLTESGLCCSINMMPPTLLFRDHTVFEPTNIKEPDENVTRHLAQAEHTWKKWDYSRGFIVEGNPFYPLSPKTSGKSNSLALLLYANLDNYYCTSSDSTGFLMAAHKAMESPHPIDFGLAIPPGAEVHATIIPEITIADASISEISIVSRSCYFLNEFPLTYYKAYTDSNCQDECISNYTIQNCGCALYYQPRDNLTRICDGSDVDCNKFVIASLQEQIDSICSSCLPLCNEMDYRVSSSLSGLQNHSMLWPPGADGNISKSHWYGKPVTILNIFFGERTTVAKVRKRLFGSTDLIANVGGLLGLCLGFSGLSAIELLYFCTLRMWFQKIRIRHVVSDIVSQFINRLKAATGRVLPSPPEDVQNTNYRLENPIPAITMTEYPDLASWEARRVLSRNLTGGKEYLKHNW